METITAVPGTAQADPVICAAGGFAIQVVFLIVRLVLVIYLIAAAVPVKGTSRVTPVIRLTPVDNTG
jgi:hypothetical protein